MSPSYLYYIASVAILLTVDVTAAYAASPDAPRGGTPRTGVPTDPPPDTAYTFAYIGIGYGVTQFGEGLEDRFDAGNFSNSGGGVFDLAVFRKPRWLPHAAIGLRYKNLGASPSTGDGGEEMFFNYWSTGVAVRYYPLDRAAVSGLYLQPEFTFVTQFTQKYRVESEQRYDHQFAIGSGAAVSVGYGFPLWGGRAGLEVAALFDYASRGGEVTGVGSRAFTNTNLGGVVRLRF